MHKNRHDFIILLCLQSYINSLGHLLWLCYIPLYTFSFMLKDPVPRSAMMSFQSPSACISDRVIHCVNV